MLRLRGFAASLRMTSNSNTHPDPAHPHLLYLLGRGICRIVSSREFDLKVYGS